MEEDPLEIIGFLTVVVLGLGVLAVVYLLVKESPQIARYLKIRKM